MLRCNVPPATVNFRATASRVTCAKRLELMRSASSLCVQSVVNHASLAEDFGTLLVSVCTVLEVTRPSLTCETISGVSHPWQVRRVQRNDVRVASKKSQNAVVNDILRACAVTSFSKEMNSGSS